MNHKILEPQQGFFPQPIYMIGTVDESEKINFAPVSWLTSYSGDPPGIMVAMTKRMMTCENIINTKKFSANLATKNMREMIDYCGSISGYDCDKVDNKKVPHYLSSKVGVPILTSSPWVFECEVTQTLKFQSTILFLSTVISIYADASIKSTNYGEIDLKQLNPLIYSPSQYFALGEYLGQVN